MTHSSARVLEFDALRELVRGYTSSDLGRVRVAQLAASTDLAWIQNQQQLAGEVREFRRVGGSFNFFGLTPISDWVEKAGISGVALEALEIVSVITVVDRAAEWREIALNPPQGMKQEWTAVRQLSSGIGDFTEFLRGFRNKILPDGMLDDKASPQLASTRRIGERAKEIASSLEILAELEVQFAKARFAEEYDCVAPQLGSGESPSRLILRDARHPLLERNLRSTPTASDKSVRPTRVVPVTIELEAERRELFNSRPHTRGKTVGL